MKISQSSPYTLTTNDSPITMYLVGFFFFVIGAIVAGVTVLLPFSSVSLIPLGMGILFALAGLVVILFAAKRIICTFDKAAGTVTIAKKGLISGTQTQTYPLSSLQRLDVEILPTRGSGRNGGSPTYRVRMIMGSGEYYTLSSASIGDRGRVERDFFAIDSFLRGGAQRIS